MSRAYTKIRSCRSKARYTVAEVALSDAQRIRRLDPTARVHVYRCPFCEGLHVGNVPRKRVLRQAEMRFMQSWVPELGTRAAALLRMENDGRSGRRRTIIARHFAGAARREVRSA